MKKMLTLIMVFALTVTLAGLTGCSELKKIVGDLVDEIQNGLSGDDKAELSAAGVTFVWPELMKESKGTFQPAGGDEYGTDKGFFLSEVQYVAVSREKYAELAEKGSDLTQEDYEFLSPRVVDFLLVYTIDGGRGYDELAEILAKYELPAEGCKELGKAGEYRFFAVVDPFADELDTAFTFDEGFREEYDEAVAFCKKDTSWIRIKEPDAGTAETGTALKFETTDLEGGKVRSEDVFAGNRLTMVNLWGTFCGPCINEMPDLEVLRERLEKKNCGLVGVVLDVNGAGDSARIKAAEDIIADTGVTYLNLLPWGTIDADLPAQYIPTTYFVDSQGRVVGEAAVGARGADDYEKLVDELLAGLE